MAFKRSAKGFVLLVAAITVLILFSATWLSVELLRQTISSSEPVGKFAPNEAKSQRSRAGVASGQTVVLSTRRPLAQMPFVRVVVVVTSAAGWVDRRERIRKQFPRNMELIPDNGEVSVLLKFAIGRVGVSNDTLQAIQMEAFAYSDVLFLDCPDEDDELKHPHLWRRDAGVSSTTCKVMLSVQWAVRRFDFEYFFRLGDDSYFRVDKFVAMIGRELPATNAVVGHIMTDTVFGMQQLYPQGMGYGVTYDACKFVASNTDVLLKTAPEDCVVARWLFAVGAEFIDSPRWIDIDMGDNCHSDMVLAHKLPSELWTAIADDGTVAC